MYHETLKGPADMVYLLREEAAWWDAGCRVEEEAPTYMYFREPGRSGRFSIRDWIGSVIYEK